MRLVSEKGFSPLCGSTLIMFDRASVPSRSGLNQYPCIQPSIPSSNLCCQNCWSIELPEVTNGQVMEYYCAQEPTWGTEKIPAQTFNLLPAVADDFGTQPNCYWSQQNVIVQTSPEGNYGGVTIILSTNTNTYYSSWPVPGWTVGVYPAVGRPKWVLFIQWVMAFEGRSHTAYYGCTDDNCGTKQFSLAYQQDSGPFCTGSGSSSLSSGTADWPETLTARGLSC